MADQATVTQLDSGLRVVTETVPAVRSVALGMWVATGSRDEQRDQAGVSHFLEHLLFKGTARHSAIELSELFDGLGAAVNAATSKETTHLHARFLDEHLAEAFDVMAEMLLAPTYPEVDSERQVVIEEIAMYEDEPQDKVHDVLGEAVFGDHVLGRPIIGRAEVISSITVPDIRAYHAGHYVAPNLCVSAAGRLDHDQVVELARRHLDPADGDARAIDAAATPAEPLARTVAVAKDTEQYHLCLGGLGLSRSDERRFALSVLNTILGGSSSSRLFREIREKRGLAYAVGSFSEQYLDTGMVGLYVGTREDNLAEAGEILARELRALGETVTADELARAKESVKGRLVLSMESTASRMSRNARSVLLGLPLLTLDELLARIEAVTVDDVHELAGELYAPQRLSAAAVGTDPDRFKAALAPVSEALAA